MKYLLLVLFCFGCNAPNSNKNANALSDGKHYDEFGNETSQLPIPTTTKLDPSKVLISDDSYKVMQYSCTQSCKPAGDPELVKYYCACICAVSTGNAMIINNKYKLKYEVDMMAHMDEIMPDKKQVASCISKSKQ